MKTFRHHVLELFFMCMGAGSAQFRTTVDRFSGHFMPRTVFLCRLNLLYVIHACWIFLCCYPCFKKKKTRKKFQFVCDFILIESHVVW